MNLRVAEPATGTSWFLSGLGAAQLCSWGTLYYSFPLIAEAMEQELGWSKPSLYGALSLGVVLSALLSYPVGAIIDKGKGRNVMAGASILAGLLLFAWSRIDSLALFYVVVAGIGALQAATLYDPVFAVIARRVGARNARKGIVTITLWGGFASTVFVPLIQVLMQVLGWRDTLVTLAAINIFFCAVLYFRTIDPRLDGHGVASHEAAEPSKGQVRRALRHPAFWLLAIAFTAYFAAMTAFLFHLYPLLKERLFDEVTIGAIIMVIGPAQVAGRFFIMVLASKATARRLGTVAVALFPLAMALIWAGPSLFPLMLFAAALYGAVNGIMTIVRGLAVPEMVSPHAYGALNGILAMPTTIAKALAPLAAAWLWSVEGSYSLPMLAIVVSSLVMTATFWWSVIVSKRRQAVPQ
jgi:predicted MFS family arabinose efflux permease